MENIKCLYSINTYHALIRNMKKYLLYTFFADHVLAKYHGLKKP